jgi:hypothetical protein
MKSIKLLLLALFASVGIVGSEPLPNVGPFSPDNHYDIGTLNNAPADIYYKGKLIRGSGAYFSHARVSLTAAQIIAMEATPVQLIAAPGAGRVIAITKAQFRIVRTSTSFTGGGAVQIQYGSTAANGGTQALDSTIASTVITTADTHTVHAVRNGAVLTTDPSSGIDNTGIYITNASASFAAGTGTATVDIWYVVY